MGLIFIVTIKTHHYWKFKILKRQYQSYAISAKDFTLEVYLSSKQTDHIIEVFENKTDDQSFAEVYMKKLSSDLESLLGELHQKYQEIGETSMSFDANQNDNFFEISTIFFSFKHRDLLYLLDDRGTHIRKGSREGIEKKNEEIQKLFEESYDEMKRPLTAYVTFKSVKASQVAKRLLNQK